MDRLRSGLSDDRSGRVVFVSHCLLNENTRYLGGAFRPGAVVEVVEPFLRDGTGICQMPCPEQAAWGGVLKRHLLHVYGRRHLRPVVRAALPLLLAVTRLRYRRLAARVARQVSDYVTDGFEVVGIVGVGASPSCGVATTLDVTSSLGAVAGCPPGCLDRRWMNEHVVAAAARPGRGLFVEALDRALDRRGLSVAWFEHDLRSEWPESPVPAGARPVRRSGGALADDAGDVDVAGGAERR
ncbi:MAG: DUF523 domain-containing protein [Acidimicrobiales bacterium]|nr:DUF523 domain-containing protein [Acidimicrobiales bacterium]